MIRSTLIFHILLTFFKSAAAELNVEGLCCIAALNSFGTSVGSFHWLL